MAVSFEAPYDNGQTSYGLTPGAWRDFDPTAAMVNPAYGEFHLERFRDWVDLSNSPASNEKAVLTQATAGTANLISGPVGFGQLLEIDSASSTTTQGANLQFTKMGFTPSTGECYYFEAMLRLHDIATGVEFFAGLSAVDTTIIASSAVTTGYKIGFSSVTNDKVLKCVSGTNATPTAATGSPLTLVDGDVTTDGTEWVRLALRAEVGSPPEFYVNSTKFASDLTAAVVPSGASAVLLPSFVVQVETTSIDAIARVAWFAVGRKFL
jgi:hypothetical protein